MVCDGDDDYCVQVCRHDQRHHRRYGSYNPHVYYGGWSQCTFRHEVVVVIDEAWHDGSRRLLHEHSLALLVVQVQRGFTAHFMHCSMGTNERGAVFVQQTAIATHEDVFDFDQQCLIGEGAIMFKLGSVREPLSSCVHFILGAGRRSRRNPCSYSVFS